MKSVAITFCVLCFQFEALYGGDSCSSRPCKNTDQAHVSDSLVMVEFKNGNFKLTFPNPKNVSEFSMTLLKGREKKEICAFHLSEEKDIHKSNVTYCQTKHSNSSTTFILENLERKHTDIYTYCLEMLLPPPYIDCRLKETYLYIQDKEDCISLGLMSWIITGLIMFAMISCICCVVACCLRNKKEKQIISGAIPALIWSENTLAKKQLAQEIKETNQHCESSSHEYNSEYMPMAAVNAAKKPRI